MQRIVLHVDMDSFFAALEELRRPEIRGKAVVVCVYSGRTSDSGAVSTANYRARELGIKSGMTIYSAKRLAMDKDVVFLPVDMEHYRAVSLRIMELLSREADAVEQVSVDEAYLDITRRSKGDFLTAGKIGIKIKRKIKEQESLTCSVGIGHNKFVAKMASKRKKPDGLTVVKPEEVLAFLGDLPVAKLHGIGKKTEEALNELGIRTAKELLGSRVDVLFGVFGENKAKMLLDKASGIDDEPVEQHEMQQISRIGTLKHDSDDVDFVFQKIKEISVGMKENVEKRKVAFRTVSVITIDTQLETRTRSETIALTDDVEVALAVGRRLLAGFFGENPGIALRRVGIRVSNFVDKKKQRTLGDF
ncbi:MAG: DNA polymerase IV [archaeon]